MAGFIFLDMKQTCFDFLKCFVAWPNKMNHLRYVLIVFFMTVLANIGTKAQYNAHTWCNPVNLDYTYAIFDSDKNISYRSGADPAVVEFRGGYYMFVTRSMGYWYSADLRNWRFIHPEKWYFQGSNAPAAHNYKDSVLYVTGDPSGAMSVLYTDNPIKGDWKATPAILHNLQDPGLFIDDDGEAYMFWGSSNVYPIRGRKLDRNRRFLPAGDVVELFGIDMDKHGWERFGENHADTVLSGYIEGPWMTKHNSRYYLTYGAPGTEFNVYADGVYVADHPLGPYVYAPNNPVSYKPGGFMNGAGHGSIVRAVDGSYWHFATMAISSNMNWERRIAMFPTYFDKDGLMYSNTAFGDYPHYAPNHPRKGEFTGWMLLSYKKPVKASSVKEGFDASRIVDENAKTFWVAQVNDDNQWLEIDLETMGRVHAIQVNYHDYQSDIYGKVPGLFHRYTIEGSVDGINWLMLADKSENYTDVPNDYVELAKPADVRFIRFKSIYAPMNNLAISGLRIFGVGSGKVPAAVRRLEARRMADRRDALIRWEARDNVQGYNVRWGIAPDKLYSSWLVYDVNELELKSLTIDQEYYVSVEAFNENGVSVRSKTIKIE